MCADACAGGGRRIGQQRARGSGPGKPKGAAADGDDSPTSVLEAGQEPDEAPPPPRTCWQLVGQHLGGKGDASLLLSSSARGLRQGLIGGAL